MKDLTVDLTDEPEVLCVNTKVCQILDVLAHIVADEDKIAIARIPRLEDLHDLGCDLRVGRECALSANIWSVCRKDLNAG
jgi:hypothetical protein